MARKSYKKYFNRVNFVFSCFISSSLLLIGYTLPIKALRVTQEGGYIIAKLPDEREQEAVSKFIEKIDTSQVPATREKPRSAVESPLAPKSSSASTQNAVTAATNPTPTTKPQRTSTPSATAATNPTPTTKPQQRTTPSATAATNPTPTTKPQQRTTPSATAATNPTPTTKPQRTSTPSATAATNPTPTTKPQQRTTPSATAATNPTPTTKPQQRTTPSATAATNPTPTTKPQQRTTPSATAATNPTPTTKPQRKPNAAVSSQQRNRQTIESSPINASKQPTFKEINFVDFALGILTPKDYRYKGRYFHFYQFEGSEKQHIQIRLTGSDDRRRTNNLKLEPFVLLLDPDNNVLVSRGTTGRNKDAFIFAQLPVTGKYTIAVTSREPGDTGRYSLAIRNDPSSYLFNEIAKLDKGLTLKKNNNFYDISKFQGRKYQRVSIRVDSVYEEFAPYVVLMNSKGQVVASDIDEEGKYTALIDAAQLPEDGIYYVVVISAIPNEYGRYRLSIF